MMSGKKPNANEELTVRIDFKRCRPTVQLLPACLVFAAPAFCSLVLAADPRVPGSASPASSSSCAIKCPTDAGKNFPQAVKSSLAKLSKDELIQLVDIPDSNRDFYIFDDYKRREVLLDSLARKSFLVIKKKSQMK